MTPLDIDRIRLVDDFESLIVFLRDELEWPLEAEDIEELSFDYEPEELGLSEEVAVRINSIKQLRPLAENQPWGIFYIGFEPKRLPVVVLRRVLQKLVIKKRQSAKSAHRNAWELHDLLFISSYGEENQRAITFAHFSEDEESKLPTLRVIGWDSQDTPLHMDRCIHELQNLTFDEELSPDKWREQWSEAFTLEHREVITTSKALAKKLAALAGRIRKRANKILAVESKKGPMRQLYKAFQETLIHDLDEDDFADMYAQTITYGLFSTKKSRPAGLVAENLLDMIPRTNPFLKELLSTFLTVGGCKGKIDFDELGIDDVVQTLRNTDMDAVLRDFEDRNPLEDPVIHFYEGFLKEYDAKKKIKRGVFYTPRPVVSFIVRSVDEILRKDFGLEDGLADTTTWGEMARRNKDIKIPEGVSEHDPFVQILDPAVGTGTFLVEVIGLIYKTMKSKWEKEGHMPLEFNKLWNEYIPKHLLPRLYGFELMMAPYAIAHMKIGLKLFETGYRFDSDERARIYLTNTLEEPKDITEYFEQYAPALAHEAQAANKVKTELPVTIILGNPPYSGHSQNNEITSIVELVKDYTRNEPTLQGPGQGKWLQDDYVKFLRHSSRILDNSHAGILGMITNHRYLTNRTFKGMRKCFLHQFSKLRILDLHGNKTVAEVSPIGEDENVFDIEQGVCIGLFSQCSSDRKSIAYAELWGPRLNEEKGKYNLLLNRLFFDLSPMNIEPSPPEYQFVSKKTQNLSTSNEFENMLRITELMPNILGPNKKPQSGLATMHDKFAISFTQKECRMKIEQFLHTGSREEAIELFGTLCNPAQWDYDAAKKSLASGSWLSNICKIYYSPFDQRITVFDKSVAVHLRRRLSDHLFNKDNLALVVGSAGQEISGKDWDAVSCVDSILQLNYFRRNGSPTFPLYVYPEAGSLHKGKKRYPNINRNYINSISETLELICENDGIGDLRETIGPENLFQYIYAIFHSPEYRKRYSEFLKSDFPRIPKISKRDLFRDLCNLGNELVELHLMKSKRLNDFVTAFPVSGDNAVSKVGEKGKALSDVEDGKGKLFINKTQYFNGLPEEVWNFHIGGYQVCHKWLKDRKGRKLSAEDIEHYHKIVVALNETIKIMKQIDETIDAHGGWPIK